MEWRCDNCGNKGREDVCCDCVRGVDYLDAESGKRFEPRPTLWVPEDVPVGGKWIEAPNDSYSWDEIMRRTICPKCCGMVKWHYGEEHRYCYHCGAKMKEGK